MVLDLCSFMVYLYVSVILARMYGAFRRGFCDHKTNEARRKRQKERKKRSAKRVEENKL
jgi:hypothetical protein